jgi:hypothetical protein
MNSSLDAVLDTYLRTYRDLIAVERSNSSVTLSFPFHLAAGHRIELTVTDLGTGRCVISDAARTLGEVQAAGYKVTNQAKERIERVAGLADLRIVNQHLVLECSPHELGPSIQKFLEASKTIGDVYLVHRYREKPDKGLIAQVRRVLDSKNMLYRLGDRIPGRIENHPFDIVVPSNGRPGLAVSVIGGQNTHNIAQIWYYKCDDVRHGEWYEKSRSKLALIYDVRHQEWSEASRAILESTADIAIPSDLLSEFGAKIE